MTLICNRSAKQVLEVHLLCMQEESNGEKSDGALCPICLEEIVLNEQDSIRNKCSHRFHGPCLRQAIRHGLYHCPICRGPLGEVALPQDKRLIKYAKMLRVKLPSSTVKQKMEVDGIPAKAIDDFFTGGLVGVNSENGDALKAENGESHPAILTAGKAFKSYMQMLKMNIHEEAVRLRMRAAGVAEEVIDLFFVEYWNKEVCSMTMTR